MIFLDFLLDCLKIGCFSDSKMQIPKFISHIHLQFSLKHRETHNCDTLLISLKGNNPRTLINQSHWSDVTCSLFSHKECKQSRWYLVARYSH